MAFKVKESKSKSLELNKEDITKVGKGAIIAICGALLTYISEIITEIDFGEYTPMVVAVGGVLINLGWKYIRNNK
jgi:hypothetical protein